jgi:hypothetical protein
MLVLVLILIRTVIVVAAVLVTVEKRPVPMLIWVGMQVVAVVNTKVVLVKRLVVRPVFPLEH